MPIEEKNPNSVLFLYEGETENEFYKKIFNLKLEKRKIRLNFGSLNGVFNINDKVKSKIKSYLQNPKAVDCNKIHVFIAFDRDGELHVSPSLNKSELAKEFLSRKSRIASINEIVATQDLESWFFHDIEGIYNHLNVPKKNRNLKAYPNIEKTNNRILSDLFHRYNKHYQKGKRAEGFIDSLNLEKIYENATELKETFELIKTL